MYKVSFLFIISVWKCFVLFGVDVIFVFFWLIRVLMVDDFFILGYLIKLIIILLDVFGVLVIEVVVIIFWFKEFLCVFKCWDSDICVVFCFVFVIFLVFFCIWLRSFLCFRIIVFLLLDFFLFNLGIVVFVDIFFLRIVVVILVD